MLSCAAMRNAVLIVVVQLTGCHLVFPHAPAVSRDSSATDLALGEGQRRDVLAAEGGADWQLPQTCLLDGVVRAKGDADPASNCRICDPAFSTAFWAPALGCLITLAITPKLDDPHGLALSGASLLVAEEAARRVIRVDLATGAISTLVNYPTVDGPRGLRLHGNALYIVEAYQHEVSVFDLGSLGLIQSKLFDTIQEPYDLVVDPGGVTFVCDAATHAVYKGSLASPLPLASFNVKKPSALALAGSTLFVADEERVFSYDLSGGTFKAVAGNPAGCTESLPSVVCLSSRPQGLALDGKKRLLVVDSYHHRVLRVAGTAGEVIAGKLYSSGSADGPLGSNRLADPAGIAVHGDYVFIADKGNDRIRVLRPGP